MFYLFFLTPFSCISYESLNYLNSIVIHQELKNSCGIHTLFLDSSRNPTLSYMPHVHDEEKRRVNLEEGKNYMAMVNS